MYVASKRPFPRFRFSKTCQYSTTRRASGATVRKITRPTAQRRFLSSRVSMIKHNKKIINLNFSQFVIFFY